MYDEDRPAQWVTREELDTIWNGEALVIERLPASEQESGPRIEWDTCFIDNGVVKIASTGLYSFKFRNTGNKDLLIDQVKLDCGCSAYTVKSKRLAPGERGVIDVSVAFDGKEGYFQSRTVVTTNDTANRLSLLRVAAGIPRGPVLSANRLSLGNVPQGGKTTWEFYARDPGFDGLCIRDVYVVPVGGLDAFRHLASKITYCRLGENATYISRRQGVRHRPEDYIIRVTLEPSAECPVGPFQGEVVVVAAVGKDVSTYKVAVTGDVVPDVCPVPGIALISLDDHGDGSATIQLQSQVKKEFRIDKTWVDNGFSVKIVQDDVQKPFSKTFILSAHMPDIVAGGEPIEFTAFFKLGNGDVVHVPIAVVGSPLKRSS